MPRKKSEEPTRQLYAAVREDLYLASKAKAAERRMSLREFVEHALELALSDIEPSPSIPLPPEPSVWEDEYIRLQARQPIGSPVELTREEAVRLLRASLEG